MADTEAVIDKAEGSSDGVDVIHLLKHDAVELDDGSIMYIMSYYRKGTYDRCSVKVCQMEEWNDMMEGLRNSEPAMNFRMSDIGLDDDRCDVIYSHGRKMTRLMAYELLKLKFSPKKLRKPMDFVNEEFYMMGNVKRPYLRKYNKGSVVFDILDMIEIPKGEWFSSDRERCTGPKRKPRVIM